MKNPKKKRKLSVKKKRSGEVLINLFVYKKNQTCKKYWKKYMGIIINLHNFIPNKLQKNEFSFKKTLFSTTILYQQIQVVC